MEEPCYPFSPLSSANSTLYITRETTFHLYNQCAKICTRAGAIGLGHGQWNQHYDRSMNKFLPDKSKWTLYFWNNYDIVLSNKKGSQKICFKKSQFSSPFLKVRKKAEHKHPVEFLLCKYNHEFRIKEKQKYPIIYAQYYSNSTVYSHYFLVTRTNSRWIDRD